VVVRHTKYSVVAINARRLQAAAPHCASQRRPELSGTALPRD
jgi:hypothetical protein